MRNFKLVCVLQSYALFPGTELNAGGPEMTFRVASETSHRRSSWIHRMPPPTYKGGTGVGSVYPIGYSGSELI